MAQVDAILQLEIRSKRYPEVAGAREREVIRGLQLDIGRGEFVCLLGPSGCGKTSLLNLVAGLDTAFDGRVELRSDQAGREPRVAYVFQAPRLLPWRTVGENLDLAVQSAGVSGSQVHELLEIMGIADTLDMYPSHLSTGMQRRVALVRAFAIEPDLLLMDEPLVSLDAHNAARIRSLLLEVCNLRHSTVLFVTHDVGEAIYLADRIVELTASPTRVARELEVGIARHRRHDVARLDEFKNTHFLAPSGPAVRSESA